MNEQNEQDTATLPPRPRRFLRTRDDRFLGGVGAVWATAKGGGIWVAIAVILLGLGAVAGALTGGRKAAWLLAPALWIAALGGLVAAADVRFDGGYGDRHYRPTEASALPAHGYKLSAGRLRVDLRRLRL